MSHTGVGATRPASGRRLDIQGLRAVAVLLVVAFHAGLAVPGGFIGVDVFFVISGFVITSMLLRERHARGSISLRTFYTRRFKRLTPALAVMVSVVMVASALFLMPLGDQQFAAKTGLGAMLLMANVVIARTPGGYFDPGAEGNPLLNTWSLSVEEQFYLVFPVVLMVVLAWESRRRGMLGRPWVLLGISLVVSFGLAWLGSSVVDRFAQGAWLIGFYSPVSRAWEFAVGALIALGVRHGFTLTRLSSWISGLLGAGILIVAALVIHAGTAFPGPWTLMPVTGAALIILAGCSDHNAGVSRLLSLPPLVRIGDWSYSIYLWHWPLIVFAVYLWPWQANVALIAAAVSFAPAVASYTWVEQPLRQISLPRLRNVGLFATAVVLPPIVLSGTLWWTSESYLQARYLQGTWGEMYAGEINHVEFNESIKESSYPCHPGYLYDTAPQWVGMKRCLQSQPGQEVTVALVGDSHAESLYVGLAEELPDQNIAYYIVHGNPFGQDPRAQAILQEVAKSPSIETVIISAYWASLPVKEAELEQYVATLETAGKTVFVIGDIPAFPFDAQGCKFQKTTAAPLRDCTVPTDWVQKAQGQADQDVRNVVTQFPGAYFVDTARYFCDNDTCDMRVDGQLMYRDGDHLNLQGSQFVARRLFEESPTFHQVLKSEPTA